MAALLPWWKQTNLHKYLIFTTLNTNAHTCTNLPIHSKHKHIHIHNMPSEHNSSYVKNMLVSTTFMLVFIF